MKQISLFLAIPLFSIILLTGCGSQAAQQQKHRRKPSILLLLHCKNWICAPLTLVPTTKQLPAAICLKN